MDYIADCLNPHFLMPKLVSFANDREQMGKTLLKSEEDFAFEVYLKLHKEDPDMEHNDPFLSFQLVKDSFKECLDTLVEINAICRLKTLDGTPYISCRHFPSDVNVFYYRPQCGGLEEAMTQVFPFITYDDLEHHISEKFPETFGRFEANYVKFDERIKWDTYMLSNKEVAGVLGFTNVNPSQLPTSHQHDPCEWY